MINNKKKEVFYFIVFVLLCSCIILGCKSKRHTDKCLVIAPNYALPQMWYNYFNYSTSDKKVDVFYIAPTCVWSWKDSSGVINDYMDIRNSNQKKAVDFSLEVGKGIFGDSCNFYAPYYRQITMDCWFKDSSEINKQFKVSMQDISSAFNYYIKHINRNRPFILVGYSQGAKAVIELLKHNMNKQVYSRMIAAYVLGYSITNKEIKNYPYIKPAYGSMDLGKTICINSVATDSAISPLLKDNEICINPISWTTDTNTYMGVMFHNNTNLDTFFVHIDSKHHVLIVDSLNRLSYYEPLVEKIFPKGNYHMQEPYLYYYALKENIIKRINYYFKTKKS